MSYSPCCRAPLTGPPLFFESILDTNTLKRLKKMLTSRNVPPPPFSRFLRNRDPVRNYDPGNWVYIPLVRGGANNPCHGLLAEQECRLRRTGPPAPLGYTSQNRAPNLDHTRSSPSHRVVSGCTCAPAAGRFRPRRGPAKNMFCTPNPNVHQTTLGYTSC